MEETVRRIYWELADIQLGSIQALIGNLLRNYFGKYYNFFKKFFVGYLYLMPLMGAVQIGIGAYTYMEQMRFEQTAVPVITEVVRMVSNNGNIVPDLMVVDGEFSNKRHVSTSIFGSFATHSKGDRVSGHFNPETGEIQNTRIAKTKNFVTLVLILNGLFFIFVGTIFIIYRRRKLKPSG